MQITLDAEIQRHARQRYHNLGVSLAEYIRRLVALDLGSLRTTSDPSTVFDLGSSGGSDIATEKDRMIGDAFAAGRKRSRR